MGEIQSDPRRKTEKRDGKKQSANKVRNRVSTGRTVKFIAKHLPSTPRQRKLSSTRRAVDEASSKRAKELLAMTDCPSEHPCPFFSMSRDKGNEVHRAEYPSNTTQRYGTPDGAYVSMGW